MNLESLVLINRIRRITIPTHLLPSLASNDDSPLDRCQSTSNELVRRL